MNKSQVYGTTEFRRDEPEPVQVSQAGWMTRHPGAYRFLVSYAPPRPVTLLATLRNDLREPFLLVAWIGSIALFALSLGLILVGEVRLGVLLLIVPIVSAGALGFLIRNMTREYRWSELRAGVVEEFLDKNAYGRCASVMLDDGSSVRVAFEEADVAHVPGSGELLEFLVAYLPGEKIHTAVAYRLLRSASKGLAKNRATPKA